MQYQIQDRPLQRENCLGIAADIQKLICLMKSVAVSDMPLYRDFIDIRQCIKVFFACKHAVIFGDDIGSDVLQFTYACKEIAPAHILCDQRL